MDSLDLLNPYLFRHNGKFFFIKEGLNPKDLDDLLDLDVRPTDIYLASYPKSGTTWMQQILLKIVDAAHPDQVEDGTNRERCPMLEGDTSSSCRRERPDPRLCRTHLPPYMLPHGVQTKGAKVVYVMRNPKDVLVSYYHFSQGLSLMEPPKSFDHFFQDFVEGKVPWGSWFEHVREFYSEKDQMNIHFVMYEDMLKDLRAEVVKLCAFLEKDLTDEAISDVVESSIFKNMKKNPKANYKDLVANERYTKITMRKGVAGDWKNHFTVAQNEYFDRVFTERMSDFPVSFTWDM
ncbi:amine sulfotransferase-like [Centropristis striata]|uniref:amine sulfotransferase-like n=1 Tax=Centropristis striata TaxID=184440 RepID=UPI0027E0BC05|nr:amine sulfotransferase-like [Centropristis striata]